MTWLVRESDLPTHRGAEYLGSLFSVGNGAFCTRGTQPEDGLGHFRGTYLAGCFTKAGYGLVYPLTGPDWLAARVERHGAPVAVSSSARELDLRTGILRRTAVLDGGVTMVEERCASWADERLAVQTLRLHIPAGIRDLALAIAVDGDVPNSNAKYYTPGQLPNASADGVRLTTTESVETSVNGDAAWLRVVRCARQTEQRTAALARVVVSGAGGLRAAGDAQAARVLIALPAGATVTVSRLVVLAGDAPGRTDCRQVVDGLRDLLASSDAAAVLNAHRAAIAAFWAGADVEIDGDERAQRAVRYALWATRASAPNDGGISSIGAKNLTGCWYRGAVFWDMDVFQLPLLQAVAPERADNHRRYRAKRLAAAERLAAQDGFAGARFPWHSYQSGTEEPPAMGGFLWQQVHISLAVANSFLIGLDYDGDLDAFADEGLPVVLAVLRFFASRASAEDDGKLHLKLVTGPDEDHHAIDDSCYTAGFCVHIARRALQLVERLGQRADAARQRVGFDATAETQVRDLAERLHIPRLDDGAPEPFAGWRQLPEPDETLVGHQGARADKATKQTDVLLLWQVAPDWDSEAVLERAWRHHAPLCNQVSSLSFGSHALLACRLGRERDAARFLSYVQGMDLEDMGGNAGHGLHGAGEANVWLATVHGAGGLRVDSSGAHIDPLPPTAWQRLAYRVHLGGQPIAVSAAAGHVCVTNHGQKPVAVTVCGQAVTLAAGAEHRCAQRRRWQPQGLEAAIFDLDGVLVSTDRLHFEAWKAVFDTLSIPFDEHLNEQLRGVSRERSLDIVLEAAGRRLDDATRQRVLVEKNDRYKQLVQAMGPADILPGARELLVELRAAGIRTGIASASRNAPLVLARTGLAALIDAIADGSIVSASKPDPQVFYLAAQRLRCLPWACVGIEDSAAGIQSIRRAAMVAIGIGPAAVDAHVQVASTAQLNLDTVRRAFAAHDNPVNPYLERTMARTAEDQRTNYAATLAAGSHKK
jgi:alpha,alpha-trehalose phosphorylase